LEEAEKKSQEMQRPILSVVKSKNYASLRQAISVTTPKQYFPSSSAE
jgi:hypothetical protein